MWYLIVSIPDLCTFTYFQYRINSLYLTKVQWDISDLPFVQNKDFQYLVSHLNISRLRLCTSNSMIFNASVDIHMDNILYKYGWNRSSDNKYMNLYLTVCPRDRRTSKYFQ